MLFTRHNRMVSPLAESGTARRSAGTAPSLQDAGAVERLQSLFLIGTAQDERHVAIVPVRDHPQRNLPQRVDDLVPETFVVPLQIAYHAHDRHVLLYRDVRVGTQPVEYL